MKIWTSDEKDDDKIIAIVDQTIYKGNPADPDAAVFELEMQRGIPKGLDGFPFSYIREINLYQGKDHIEILFGQDSTEHLKINDDKKRQEVFDHFKNNIPGAVFSHEKISALRAGKKPLIAFVIILVTFLLTLNRAIGIEESTDYSDAAMRYQSQSNRPLAGIVWVIASWGVTRVVLIFGALLAIAAISFVRKAKHLPVIDRLTLRK